MKSKKGFTLVELLAVVVVLGILTSSTLIKSNPPLPNTYTVLILSMYSIDFANCMFIRFANIYFIMSPVTFFIFVGRQLILNSEF